MEKSYKFRIYPNKEQVDKLEYTLSLCRKLYNMGLEHRILEYKSGNNISYLQQQNLLPKLKEELPEYNTIHSQVLQDVLRRLDRSYKNFFRRCKEKKKGVNIKVGFPRFKSVNRFKSITYTQSGFRVLSNGHLKLSKIGTIRMFKHREIDGQIKTLTLKRDIDWYAIFTVKKPNALKRKPETAIGIDMGLKSLVTLSNGEQIQPPKLLIKSEQHIKDLQRAVSRKVKGSNNRKKCVRKLAKAHRKVERQRDDFLHKLSKELSQKADIIVFEKLNIRNMKRNHHLAKSISDASWDKLMRYTTYKAEEAGGYVEFVNPKGTSQICSKCGAIVPKSLSVRFHRCSICGFSSDRDVNASLNILGRLPTGSRELLKTPVETLPLPSLRGGK